MTVLSRLLALLLICAPAAHAQRMPVTTTSDGARTHFELGRARLSHASFAQALSHFDAALAADPDFGLAHVYRALASADGREEHARRAGAAPVSDGERQLIDAYAAHLREDHDAELGLLDRVATRYPDDPNLPFWMGFELYGLDRFDDAVAAFGRTSTADPAYAGAYNLLGYAEMARDNDAAAERAFQQYIRLAPAEANPYDSYGEFLMLNGRLDEAESQFELALQRDAGFEVSRTNLARIGITRSDRLFSQAVAAGDADALAALYTETAVIMPPDSPPIVGRPAIREYMTGLTGAGLDGIDITTVELVRFGDTAFQRANVAIRAGGAVVAEGKSLVLWRLVDGRWLYSRDMWSMNAPAPAGGTH